MLDTTDIDRRTLSEHPSPARLTWVLAASCVAAGCLAAAFSLDRTLATRVHGSPLGPTGKLVTDVMQWPGYFWFTVIAAAAIAWSSRRGWLPFAAVLASGALAGAVGALLKWGVGRMRPFKGAGPFELHPFIHGLAGLINTPNLSFPSGHVALAASMATAAFLLRSVWRWPLAGWVVLTMCARVAKGAHYPSDVVGAAIVGTTCAVVAVTAVRRLAHDRLPPSTIPH